jgi:hypothetical protein
MEATRSQLTLTRFFTLGTFYRPLCDSGDSGPDLARFGGLALDHPRKEAALYTWVPCLDAGTVALRRAAGGAIS